MRWLIEVANSGCMGLHIRVTIHKSCLDCLLKNDWDRQLKLLMWAVWIRVARVSNDLAYAVCLMLYM